MSYSVPKMGREKNCQKNVRTNLFINSLSASFFFKCYVNKLIFSSNLRKMHLKVILIYCFLTYSMWVSGKRRGIHHHRRLKLHREMNEIGQKKNAFPFGYVEEDEFALNQTKDSELPLEVIKKEVHYIFSYISLFQGRAIISGGGDFYHIPDRRRSLV